MEKNLEKVVRVLCVQSETDPSSVAKSIGIAPQNFLRKMRAGTLRFSEVVDAARAMGYKVYIQKKGQKYDIY